MLRTQVLVIGGGPAGSTTARFLAGSGIDTILIERDLSYIKPCGGGMPSTAINELNIPEEVIRKKIKKIRIVSPKGEDVEIELKGGYLCITERGLFDSKLRELAKDKGASIVEAEFMRFEETGKNIISIVKKRDANAEIKIKSDYVVAADGITFRSGSSLGIKKNNSFYTISTHIDPSAIQPFTDACEFWFGSDHAASFYSWVFPSYEYSSVGTGSTSPRELTALLDKFIKRRLGDSLKNFVRQNLASKIRAFRMPSWSENLFNVKNILFVGDAAGMVLPVTYEGIYYAMKSGEFAARAVIEGKPGAYKKLWDSKFRNRFLLMSKIRDHLFKSDVNIEKFVALHKRPDVQDIAIRLWLRKEAGSSGLLSYLNFLRHLLKC